jgi:hypothetical protein
MILRLQSPIRSLKQLHRYSALSFFFAPLFPLCFPGHHNSYLLAHRLKIRTAASVGRRLIMQAQTAISLRASWQAACQAGKSKISLWTPAAIMLPQQALVVVFSPSKFLPALLSDPLDLIVNCNNIFIYFNHHSVEQSSRYPVIAQPASTLRLCFSVRPPAS